MVNASPKMRQFLTKKITENKIPEKEITISADKIKSIFQTGEKISPEELDLVKTLGLDGAQYKKAIKEGLDISVPAENIKIIQDRPYWSKLKSLFNVKATEPTIISRDTGKPTIKGKSVFEVTQEPTKLLLAPEAMPQEKTIARPEGRRVIQKEIKDFYSEEIDGKPATVPSQKQPVTIEKPVELTFEEKSNKAVFDLMKEHISLGEAGFRFKTGKGEFSGVSSSFPDYFKNKGYAKQDILNILDKVENKKKLTENQQSIYNDLIEGAKSEYLPYVEEQLKEAELNARKELEGVDESEISEVIKNSEIEAQSEFDAEFNIGAGEKEVHLKELESLGIPRENIEKDYNEITSFYTKNEVPLIEAQNETFEFLKSKYSKQEIQQPEATEAPEAFPEETLTEKDFYEEEISAPLKEETKAIPERKFIEPIEETSGETKQSRAYKRLVEDLKDEDIPEFDAMKIAENMQKAENYVKDDFEGSLKIAQGYDEAPADVSRVALTGEVINKLNLEGRTLEAKDLSVKLSLEGTRYGQEIVSFKGLYKKNSSQKYVDELIQARKSKIDKSPKKVTEKISNRAEKIKNETDSLASKIKDAQAILNSIIC